MIAMVKAGVELAFETMVASGIIEGVCLLRITARAAISLVSVCMR